MKNIKNNKTILAVIPAVVVLDIIFYLILKHGLKKEIQDGSAGDGKKEDKVTDVDVAVKDAETPAPIRTSPNTTLHRTFTVSTGINARHSPKRTGG